jgi:hypothetical protein
MAWAKTARQLYACDGDRYASDRADAEWAIVEPFLFGSLARVGSSAEDESTGNLAGHLIYRRDATMMIVLDYRESAVEHRANQKCLNIRKPFARLRVTSPDDVSSAQLRR